MLTWDERRESGDEPSAAELCGGDERLAAELERRIRALKGTDWLFEDEGDALDLNVDQSANDTQVIESSLTVEEFTRSLSDSGLLTRDELLQLQIDVSDDDATDDAASLAAD